MGGEIATIGPGTQPGADGAEDRNVRSSSRKVPDGVPIPSPIIMGGDGKITDVPFFIGGGHTL